MNLKVLILIVMGAAALPSVAQVTNCSQVDWQHNTNSDFRLRISGYNDGLFKPLCDSSHICAGGTGNQWFGTFGNIVTNSNDTPTIRYYATKPEEKVTLETGELIGVLLDYYTFIEWDEGAQVWWLYVKNDTLNSLGNLVANSLWAGVLYSTNPVGTYVRTSGQNLDNNPSTINVECYQLNPIRCYITLEIQPSPFTGWTNTIQNRWTSYTCDTLVEYHQFNASGEEIFTDNRPGKLTNSVLTVEDLDMITVKWPNCCNASERLTKERTFGKRC